MTSRVMWIAVAVQLATTVVRADPAGDALAHLDRGVAAYRAGDYALAHTELAAASELAPDRPNPYRWLAMTEVALGDCRTALVHIESFLSRVPAGDPRVAELVALRAGCLAPASDAASPHVAPHTAPAAPAEPDATPVYRRWWFWTAIGAVAVTAAGVTYGLTRGGDARLPPVTCDAGGCHP
jgi:Flp pilus assembly protein TadD